MGVWNLIRQNLSLKLVSLIVAILLYMFVQQERNPTTTRTLITTVEYKNLQEGYQAVPGAEPVSVVVSGPRPSVDRLKDGDIKASADLSGLASNQPAAPVRVAYQLPRTVPDIAIDAATTQVIKVQVFRQKTRKVRVEAFFERDPPPGFQYGEPIVRPANVTIRGREDNVNRVDKIVASASPVEPRASIDGEFSVVAMDSDRNVVEGVTIEPDRVHVTVPQIPSPSEQTVLANAVFSDRPAPPYKIDRWEVTPNLVKVVGRPQRVAAIGGVSTETLSAHDLTETTTLEAALIIPPDVLVTDLRGKPLRHVNVKVFISKTKPEAPPVPDASQPVTTPQHDGAPGP